MSRYTLGKPFEMKFEIENIKFRNKSYAICYVKILDSKSPDILPKKMTLKGVFPTLFKGNVYKASVSIAEDFNWGFYLVLEGSLTEVVPNSKRGLATFLKRNVGKDLTMKEAENLVDKIGVDIIDKIKKDDSILDEIDDLKPNKKKKIAEAIKQHSFFKELMFKVSGNGLQSEVANYIYDKYKEESINVLTNNPYSLINVAGLDFTTVDRIAYLNKVSYDNFSRIKAGIISMIDAYINNAGYICVERRELLREFNKFMKKRGFFAKNMLNNVNIVNKIIDEMIEKKRLSEEVYNGKSYLYRTPLYINEKNIASYINDFNLKLEPGEYILSKTEIDQYIADYEENYFTLSNGQKNAIYMALQNKFSILTGGPGTGKTQTVNTLLKCLSQYRPNLKVTLMAPTGKASNRMKELTNEDATTIHRGIKLNSFDKKSEPEILDTDFVIIDESSMIDAYLFEQLMANIPHNASILFVGDVDQLPSVGAGNILKDMIDSEKIATTRLTEVFRQSMQSNIVMNSHKIMKANVDISNLSLDDKDSDFYLDEKNSINDILDDVEMTYKELIDEGCRKEDICILAPIEDSEIGNYNLNHIIQEKFNPSVGPDSEYQINTIDVFRVGDRVMQTVNNYELGVMNGESGIITDIRERDKTGRKEIVVEYPNFEEEVVYFGGQIKELKLSYACSIHKMQGSEVPYVIHIIHDSQRKMLSRNLVYTAWTRAKKKVIVIGQKEALDKAIHNTSSNVRTTLLKERIRGEI